MTFHNNQEQNPQQKASGFTDMWQRVALSDQPDETTVEASNRNLGQKTARSLETILGYPGNVKKAYQMARDQLQQFISPGSKSFDEMEKEAFGTPSETDEFGKPRPRDIFFNPPTSSELREGATKGVAERLTGNKEFFEPRGEREKAEGELVQDLTSFFMPGTGQLRLITRLGVPLVGNAAKQGLKYLGVSEENADLAKNGMMLATTLAGQAQPAEFAANRIAQGKAATPQGMTVFNHNLNNRLTRLNRRINQGLRVPSKSNARQGIRDLQRQTDAQGRIPMEALMDARDNVNEWIAEAGGWDVPAPVRDRTVANLNEFKTALIRTIDENLAARVPQAAELYRTGYEAAAVVHQSNAISNFIEKHFGRKTASIGAKVLFPSLTAATPILPKTALATAAVYPLYQFSKVLYRVGNSPTMGRYYLDVIAEASRGNVPAMVNSLQKLDKKLAEEEKKDAKKGNASLEDFKMRFMKKG